MTGAPLDLLTECEALGIQITPAGDGRLTIDAPQDVLTPELLARLRAYKTDLLAALAVTAKPPVERETATASDLDLPAWQEVETIDLPAPCPNCGHIFVWWDGLDRQHCLACDPPSDRVKALPDLAERLRKQPHRKRRPAK